ncbi:MAG TPA: hypothetical protein VLX91_03000 [Candidatus Acidoferrales bacterium]|nr:hypothetical protein [Candidatus Acidoferrales bacterium]
MKVITLSFLLTLTLLISPERSFSQAPDSTSASLTFGNALQFQLIGGVGLNYLGELNSSSYFRIGADLSLSHSNQSGSQSNSEVESYAPPSVNSDTIATNPDQTSNSYGITLSGLYVRKLAEYRNTILYLGAGPEVTYSWTKSSDDEPGTRTSGGVSASEGTDNESTNKTAGIGPVAVLGVGSKIIEQVSLTAEIGISALYEWNSSSSGYIYSLDQPSYQYTERSNSSSHITGWVISLANVRVGILIGL